MVRVHPFVLMTVEQHISCDRCGARLFETDFDVQFDYSFLVESMSRKQYDLGETGWVVEKFPCPEDRIAICREHFCPDCA